MRKHPIARPNPRPALRRVRGRVSLAAIGAMVASLLAAAGSPATAAQASGHDVPVWQTGWSWTYATTFTYDDGGSTHAQINENVTYTNTGPTTFKGQPAYRLELSGSITGGSGHVSASGINADLTDFSGSVSGTEYIRRSDLALLQETQKQHLNAKAKVSFISVNVKADVDITLTPDSGWHNLDFPLNPGDAWSNDVDIDYTGGFSYDAGSVGGSGGSDLDGSVSFSGPSSVSPATITAGGHGSLATDLVSASAQTEDGKAVDDNWWSPTFKNVAKEHLALPLDGATLTQDRTLVSASTPAPSTSITETLTPSLSCAGGVVTVAGRLGSGASGKTVTVTLDQSALSPGRSVTASTATGPGGAYSTTITAPADQDGLHKSGSRGNWGVLVSGGGATNVATLVVTPQDCSTLAYTGATSAPTGTDATVTAKLTDLAGGSVAGRKVSFALGGGQSVTARTDASGIASATLPVDGNPRTTRIDVAYAGAGDLTPAGDSAQFTVAQDPTTTSLSASASSVTIGDPVTFTATVDSPIGAGPTGQVQFYVDGSSFGAAVDLEDGSATSAPYTTTELGDLSVTAKYLGTTTYAASTSPATGVHVHKVLAPSATTLTATPSAAVTGQEVTLSAHVAGTDGGTPTGSVTFTADGDTIGSAPVDDAGDAEMHTSALSVGNHAIVASYSGDDDYRAGSSAPATVTVARSDVSVQVTSSNPTTVAGEAVDITAQVLAAGAGAGTPTGTARLNVDGVDVGDPVTLDGGAATFPALTSLLAGEHTIAVSYSGDDDFNAGSQSVTQHVTQADTRTVVSTTPPTSAEGEDVTVAATVAAVAPGSGSPTGTVTFTADGETIGAAALSPAADGGSTASIDLDTLPEGTHAIRASYGGDDSYGASQGEAPHTVIAAASRVATTTTLTASKNPSTFGEFVSYTATVRAADDGAIGPVGGTVQFSIDGTDIGDPVAVGADGTAQSPIIGSPAPGTHTVLAAYAPDPLHLASGAQLTQTVDDAEVAVHLRSSQPHSTVGTTVHFTADVASLQAGTGTPTGFVQFSVDGAPLGDAVEIADGSATSPDIGDLAPGSHTVTALYSGDRHFNGASASMEQRVDKVTTATGLTISPANSTYGDTVTLTATVRPGTTDFGLPVGTIEFVEDGTVLASAPVSGSDGSVSARVDLDGLSAGSHRIKAVYSGSHLFAASESGAKTATVAKRGTSLVAEPALVRLVPLGLPLGQLSATLTSSLGPVAGAPVVFRIGTATACTATTDADGVATCSAGRMLLQLILHFGYTADYGGDANFKASDAKAGIIR